MADSPPPDFEFVDAHHHLWDLDWLYYPWLTDQPFTEHPLGDYSAFMKSYPIDQFLADTAEVNVIKSVHLEAVTAPQDALKETEWIQSVIDSHRLPTAIIAQVNLTQADAATTLEQHRQFTAFRGARMLSQGSAEMYHSSDFRRGFEVLNKLGLVYDMDADYPHFEAAYDLATTYPEAKIILGHCGFPKKRTVDYFHHWRKGLLHLAQAPNVACKISGLAMVDHHWTVESIRPWVETCIEAFGPSRCMFGTNWPVDSMSSDYASVVRAYWQIVDVFSPREQQQLFRQTAENWYQI